eukprot:gnl/MRDRNA2_/MRDRNA2_77186_c0_seq2.p1 gnl/MRDRNA2_/MRDRNA2_77186_c0~~gnl/MRDRNA2_/MRDRNA2_77186_c0_seq2.p1  ORF type:complete len:531 (+),score=121.38 gnl/MRDRNA2_/MRDRNA2_77186_c0_seq2:29-1621(+)
MASNFMTLYLRRLPQQCTRMMHGITVVMLLAFDAHASYLNQEQSPWDKLVDHVVDKLSERVVKTSSLHYAELDRTALAKPGQGAVSRRSSLQPWSVAKVGGHGSRKMLQRTPMNNHQMQVAVASVGPSCGVWFSGSRGGSSPFLVHAATTNGGTTSMSEAPVYLSAFDPTTGEFDASSVPDAMGIYAVFDAEGKLQYVGLSKKIRMSVEAHAKVIGPKEAPSLIAEVRCAEMPGKSKEDLQNTWRVWINEHMQAGGGVPPGNLPENAPGNDPRWKSQGQTAQSKQSLTLGPDIKSMEEAMEKIESTVTKHPVVLFMKGTPAMPQCGFSARSTEMLKATGTDFESVNILDAMANPLIREAVKQYSSWPTIPQLYVKGQFIGGCDIITDMYSDGSLKTTLEAAASGKAVGETGSAGEAGAEPSAPPGKVELIDSPSRPTATQMSKVLKDNFQLHTLKIIDNSADHEGDAGALEMGLTGESHFEVVLVSPDFESLSPVQRQQKVYTALGDLMQRIHAITFVTKTPAELSQSGS